MNLLKWLLRALLILSFAGALLGGGAVAGLYYYISPQLPSIDILKEVRLQVPLRIYDRDGGLIAEYGEKRRIPLRMEEIPQLQANAFLAAEDDRFYEHPGVDYQGLLRAAWELARTGQKRQGGSTITMQVARNFFLSSEKTYLRKLSEIFLALKIEQELTKGEILELYLNKIYLGHRAYGIGAAAQVYYGKPIGELTLAQMATIAGLPKAPARDNPISDPARAKERRNYVLKRMLQLGHISREEHDRARAEPTTARHHALPITVRAPYVAEMVRRELVERYGEEAYTLGLRVHTTLDAKLQAAANRALGEALLDYDRRHGYRGPEQRLEHSIGLNPAQWDSTLAKIPTWGGLRPALVTAVEGDHARLYLGRDVSVELPWEEMAWAAPYINLNLTGKKPAQPADVVAVGDVVRIQEIAGKEEGERGWRLAQLPEVEGALIALNPDDGAILALNGGFDFYRSKFNRATQAKRQPGSNFKPFIYSAAFDHGFTAASLINDAPVVFEDPSLESSWRPENYSGKFYGPTRIREALTRSRNLVSIRLLDAVGIPNALAHAERFGFDRAELPSNLSLALGSGVLAPLQVVSGYAVFANGGYRVEPYHIRRIEDSDGAVLFDAEPLTVCRECEENTTLEFDGRRAERVVSPQNVYITTSILRDVIKRGTGRRALVLGRGDLAGKTGTTNEQRDAWFTGYNGDLVATAWVGFDSTDPLGKRETGGRAALPMWIDFMKTALDGVEEKPFIQPPGLVTLRIDPTTGKAVNADFDGAIFETFPADNLPEKLESGAAASSGEGGAGLVDPLF